MTHRFKPANQPPQSHGQHREIKSSCPECHPAAFDAALDEVPHVRFCRIHALGNLARLYRRLGLVAAWLLVSAFTLAGAEEKGLHAPSVKGARPVAAYSASAQSRLFHALGQIESGENDRAIGSAGEVSRYQVRPELWRQFARSGEVPTCEPSARRVVTRIMAGRVAAHGRTVSPFEFYVLWNAPRQLSKKCVSSVVRERASRFANLSRQ
jgi:hypothetical protein